MSDIVIDLLYELSKARTRLISRAAFFGYIAMQTTPRKEREGEGIPTAAIAPDGTLVANEEFVSKLTPKQIAGLYAHEVMHPALFYWQRLGPRDPQLFNIAHDLVINPMVDEMAPDDVELPPGSLLDRKFDGMSAEEIYDYLLEGDDGSGKTKIGTKGGGSVTIDTNGNMNGGEMQDYLDCRKDVGDSEIGRKAAKGENSAQRRLESEWKIHVLGAVQQHQQRHQGTLPGALQRFIDGLLNPTVPWQEEMRRWVGENGAPDDFSYARPHRHSLVVGVYLPDECDGGIADFTIIIDSSGSMWCQKDRFRKIASEIKGICEEYENEIRCIVIDTKIHNDLTIEQAEELLDKFEGGGGSDFRPAFELLEAEQYDGAVIAFTDGYISVPQMQPPLIKGTLWVTNRDEAPPTSDWGDHIVVKD
jgi:predicted metal-dependent peptidase